MTNEERVKLSWETRNRNKSFPEWFIDLLVREEDKERARKAEITVTEKLPFFCCKHGIYYKMVGHVIKMSTQEQLGGCQKCGRESSVRKKRENRKVIFPEWFINDLYYIEDKYLAWMGKLLATDKVTFYCEKHGKYDQFIYNHITLNTGEPLDKCPRCRYGNKTSKFEDEIYNTLLKYLDSKDIIRNQRGLIYLNNCPSELDFYIPKHKIAIECNGSYFHRYPAKPKDYHYKKYLQCREKGIRLLSIFDVDWRNRRKKIEQLIENIFIPKTKIYARKCTIVKLSYKEVKEFTDLYHLQGSSHYQSINYGLYFQGELMSLISFSKSRYSKDKEEFEIIRYVVKQGYTVIGGFQKLLKYHIYLSNSKNIVTFSDNDFFTGGIYSKAGFKLVSNSLSYYWTDYKGYLFVPREKAQLKYLKQKYPKLYEESLTHANKEDFIMESLKYIKVYRCGNFKWHL